jgi:hypothetical protein
VVERGKHRDHPLRGLGLDAGDLNDTPPVPRPAPVAEPPALGATRTVAGVPVGYARTGEGAVAAMAAYGHVLADPRVQLDDRVSQFTIR